MPSQHFRHTVPALALALLTAAAVTGCSRGDASDAPPAGAAAHAGNGASGGGAAGGARGGPGGAGGAPSIVLSATDVQAIQRGPLEAGVAITGDLRPIESADVKARLEGDLVGVYVREGDRVRQGQVLARFEASEQESGLTSAVADRASARNDLATAQWNAEQSRELFKAGAIPERDQRVAEQTVSAARARLAAAEAHVRAASSTAGDTRVLAPTSGIVEKRLVENGEHVARGASMFTVVRSDVLELAAAVPSRLAGDVRAGQRVHFVADGRPFDGHVARVSPTVDPTTRAVTVYVQIPNASGALKGNTFASGRVIGRTIPNALLLPAAAIRQSQDSSAKPFVYRVADDRLTRVPVEIGVVDEARGIAEVVSGLEPGDRVVVGNVGTLGEGMKVQVVGEKKG
ncbi:MAG TPA: efflux RND transporter periplasmic adaptor subunit [Gemmatimonadaceae bacterium]|nr:efflux RND transporter periplasmic adaptor subunit [Gemmatimonadaceae bacterium]